MIRTFSIQTLSTCLISSLLTLGLAACGSSSEPLGEREQPFSAADGNGNDHDDGNDADGNIGEESAAAACAEGLAAADAPDGFCQVTARGLCFDDAADACACAGCSSELCAIAESFPAQAFCPSDGDGDDPDAPTSDPDAPVSSGPSVGGGTSSSPGSTSPAFPGSAGCGAPGQVDPSAPTQPIACADGSIPAADGAQACNVIANGACFDDVAAACACAGCGGDGCIVQESYPAVVRCE
jgi:hypothetical protein